MSSKNIVLSGAIAGIIAVALIAAAILLPGAGVFKISPTSSESGTLGIQLTDPPTVPPGVTEVYISYSEMAVHVGGAGNQTGWYKIAPAGQIDLMSILNTSITLGSAQVNKGVYNAIGFNITSASVTVNGQNQSAYITNNKMFIPLVGGLQVQNGQSEGVLVDMSPTVLAVYNGSQRAYVLVPNAHVFHVPDSVWQSHEHDGDRNNNLQQQQWFEDGVRGNISLSHVALSNNSMSVTVTNTGNQNTTIGALTVAYPLSVQCSQYQEVCTALEHRAIPVAQFAVLSNGTLWQYNFTAAAMAHYNSTDGDASQQKAILLSSLEHSGVTMGYVLKPGQSVTFTFNGQVATITPGILSYVNVNIAVPTSLMNALTTINSGQIYGVAASGPFDTFAATQVTAS